MISKEFKHSAVFFNIVAAVFLLIINIAIDEITCLMTAVLSKSYRYWEYIELRTISVFKVGEAASMTLVIIYNE